MIDLEAIRARHRKTVFSWSSDNTEPSMHDDMTALLSYVDELREAAGKVTCRTCSGNGHTFIGIDPCPDCTDLRRLLGADHV